MFAAWFFDVVAAQQLAEPDAAIAAMQGRHVGRLRPGGAVAVSQSRRAG